MPSIGGTSTPSPSLESHQIKGTLSLSLSAAPPKFPTGTCSGLGGYSDVAEGTWVTVKNEGSTIIASGRLADGTVDFGTNSCMFAFTVDGVPRANFYTVEVSHGSGPNYSYDDLSGRNWAVAMSLGQ
jgi:hypothetical protein